MAGFSNHCAKAWLKTAAAGGQVEILPPFFAADGQRRPRFDKVGQRGQAVGVLRPDVEQFGGNVQTGVVEHDECGGGVAVVGCGGELSHKPGAGEAVHKVQFGSRPNFGQVAAEFVELHFFQAADVFAAHDGFENAWQKVFHVAGSSCFVVQWDAAEVGLQIVFGNVAQGKAQ